MNRQLLVLASGPFGKGVARRLEQGAAERGYDTALQEIDQGTHPSLWPRAELIVLATSHERPRIAEATDRAAFAWGTPWFGVHTTATEVVCGPVVVPGRTACRECYVRRRAQHRRPGHDTAAVGDDRYPTGFPVHDVGIAAAFAQQAVDEVFATPEDDGAPGGTVRKFDQISGATHRSSVVAVDRCGRCRTPATSDELWRQLASIDEGRRL
uniref:TOMM leader peptide-binding protein n=1 Tax=Streptomyces sp. NBC_01401 TaxID=2903854 RepID=A0AAU3GU00_9ACTN